SSHLNILNQALLLLHGFLKTLSHAVKIAPQRSDFVVSPGKLCADPYAQIASGNMLGSFLQGVETAREVTGQQKAGAAADQNGDQQQRPDVFDEHFPQDIAVRAIVSPG